MDFSATLKKYTNWAKQTDKFFSRFEGTRGEKTKIFRTLVIKREAATPVLSASSVILSYMITTVSETNIKKFLNPLSALCTGSQSLDSKEKNAAVEALKEAKVFPPGTTMIAIQNVVVKPAQDMRSFNIHYF